MQTKTITLAKAPTTKRTTMARIDATTLRTQARMRRARVLKHTPSITRVDAARIEKARVFQARTRVQVLSARHVDSIPISLARPSLWEVSPMALAEAGLDPQMAEIGGANMRKLLQPLSEQLYAVNGSTSIDRIKLHGREAAEVVRLTMPAADPSLQPSHCLGVFSQKAPPPGEKRKVVLYPIHAMVLAANCCQAPKLRIPVNMPQTGQPDQTVVPLIPFGVPSAETFLLTLRILYLKEYRSTFFPWMDKGSIPVTPAEHVSQYLIQRLANHSEPMLIECVKRVHGLWLNACALGIVDTLFWRWLSLAWDVYREALVAKLDGRCHLQV